MNVSSTIQVSGMRDKIEQAESVEAMREAMLELISKIDLVTSELVLQLRKEPTLFTVDPSDSDNTEITEGAKPGDVAIYTDSVGVVHTHQFT